MYEARGAFFAHPSRMCHQLHVSSRSPRVHRRRRQEYHLPKFYFTKLFICCCFLGLLLLKFVLPFFLLSFIHVAEMMPFPPRALLLFASPTLWLCSFLPPCFTLFASPPLLMPSLHLFVTVFWYNCFSLILASLKRHLPSVFSQHLICSVLYSSFSHFHPFSWSCSCLFFKPRFTHFTCSVHFQSSANIWMLSSPSSKNKTSC